MSVLTINGIPIQSLAQAPAADPGFPSLINPTIREIWESIRAQCVAKYSESVCDALLPVNPIFLPPETETSFFRAPIFWFIVGAVAYRILFR